jgi:hypothetical protein
MHRLNITAKIWLSIGVFVLGSVITTISGEWQGLRAERTLRVISEVQFPAAQRSMDAESAFQRVVKGFSDAVMTQDAAAVTRASEEGQHLVEGLSALAQTAGLSASRRDQARNLATDIGRFLADARTTYGSVLANPSGMGAETQARMSELASRTETLKVSLQVAKDSFAKDLPPSLSAVQQQSADERLLALVIFAVTLIVAGVIVNLTIRRSITGPIVRVIQGVQQAADGAAQASELMVQSGQVVARDSQHQPGFRSRRLNARRQTDRGAGRASHERPCNIYGHDFHFQHAGGGCAQEYRRDRVSHQHFGSECRSRSREGRPGWRRIQRRSR